MGQVCAEGEKRGIEELSAGAERRGLRRRSVSIFRIYRILRREEKWG
jgi:hypothetical protein